MMARQSEPCCSCGEDTSAGTPLFSDRLDVAQADGSLVWVCSFCAARARGGGREVLSDAEREQARKDLEKGTFAFGAFAPGGH